ncbi:MAG TPA: efflux transporter outer membrane subunit [Usitatibacter sp.]|jgi:multidrug efflux system outer membrane protein|nr:efflux transporter outer membrane subunit [Usitatibacter sp.]
MKARDFIAWACMAMLLGACSLEPRYDRPALPVAGAYPGGAAYGHGAESATPAADLGWKDFLEDPRLQRLVEIALANNRDLRVAVLNVEQARAQYRIQHAQVLPQVDASASHIASRTPGTVASTGRSVQQNYYSAGASLSWELDFFGRLRSLDDQALQQFFATAQARKAAQILLVSQVADEYLTLLANDDALAVTRATLTTAQKSYDLNKAQFDGGIGSELTVRQAEGVLEQAKADYAAQVRQRAQDENALVLLVGEPLPGDLPPGRPLGAQAILADVPAGLPSDLLARRPDIMEAEATLRAANANIGAARAAFFPSIGLTGGYGAESAALSGLFKGPALAWSFVPSITLPIFHGGQLRAELDVAKIRKNIGVAQYEKAIQVAFQEVANGLAARGTYDEQVGALERYVAAEQKSLDLSTMLFEGGIDDYLSVLTAQTTLYTAQNALVQARLQRLTNRVDLYRALGGGWIERTGDAPAPAEETPQA